MKTIDTLKVSTLVLALIFGTTLLVGRDLPTGGYQGGTFGNVKVKTWSGSADTKWNNPGNWCPAGIPGPTDDIVIPGSTPAMPTVDVTGMSCRNVRVKPGATVTIVSGFTLQVNGNLIIEKE